MLVEHDIAKNNYSVIQRVDDLIMGAIKRNASDIHLESYQNNLRVRYRIDGVLYDEQSIETSIALQIISRIKILAHINIAEKRVPQDGKFRSTQHHNAIDLRVSTFPSIYGEKIVIRILDKADHTIELERLGFQQSILATFNELVNRSHGFLLVAGPTGSGKTTTLYASLAALHTPQKNIITLEDPVEYNLEGITQGQIHPEAGFTFERGMRALLRQDPDIAMVGEIRDKQTARIAIEAALTGHLVLSTLHTNNAPAAIMRLMDMGIEPFLINASVTGILAQRLVRKICEHCRVEVMPIASEQKILEQLPVVVTKMYKGEGCSSCFNLGYKGRIGIFELLVVNNALRSLIVCNPIFEAIYAQALENGMQTLLHDASHKVQNGVISLQELMRVIL